MKRALRILAVLVAVIGAVGVNGTPTTAAAAPVQTAPVQTALVQTALVQTTVVVQTKAELLAALGVAVAGDTVFVTGTASINLTGTKRIVIPPGVTLASDRGQAGSLGALLYNDELDLTPPGGTSETWAQFAIGGAGVRVTGLRLRGPDREIRNSAYEYDNSRGLEFVNASDPLVDNNELYGWSHAAVYFGDTIEGRVRGNYLHHNRRAGLGYGVVLYNNTSAVIEDNTFTQNRHAIAGNGLRSQRYDARFNLVTDNANGHGFDMHGENEALGNGAPYAGDVVRITQNSFRSAAQRAIVIRGRPFTGAWVSSNCFAHTTQSAAIQQTNFTGNMFIGSNTYGTTTGSCHTTGRHVAWRMSSGGVNNYQAMAPYTFDVSEVGFGDFNGDGRTDVFRATGSRWYYSPSGTGSWVQLNVSGARIGTLRFGDFDGDGRTDVFSVSGTQWQFSSGGTAGWAPLATSSVALESLRFGDFDGDGKTDVFRTSGSQWFYSSGGRSSWAPLALASNAIETLRFGDFDGDGKTDVFNTSGGQWRYSSGGAASWANLATAGNTIETLRFGDFDGDGKTDVFQTSGGRWYFSSGGRTNWTPMASSGCPIASLYVEGDFNGDGKSDVFDGRCGG
ncbi:MAG TPA: FG-GAP-like repeat-containing protein [Candidatus Limnocylindrales bacterium]|nr:FG-GAP-like repeat-containing protein [Candidatus Limnocylindrales bacterium]